MSEAHAIRATVSREESKRPLVSVIMNCYNGEKYLGTAIDSVIAQTYRNWELIFWDNQSTDRSAEIFQSYADPRLKYFLAPNHTLLYEARNHAIAQSKGVLLAFLDVDDWWVEAKLEKQVPLFDDAEVGMACGNYWVDNQRKMIKRLFREDSLPEGWVINEVLSDYSVGLLTLMIRRTAYSQSRGFDPRYEIMGDRELVLRLSMKWKLATINEPVAHYRLHDSNVGFMQRNSRLSECELWIGEIREIPLIRRQPGFIKVINESLYVKGMMAAENGRLLNAVKTWFSLPWGINKLKLLLAIMLPKAILDRLKA